MLLPQIILTLVEHAPPQRAGALLLLLSRRHRARQTPPVHAHVVDRLPAIDTTGTGRAHGAGRRRGARVAGGGGRGQGAGGVTGARVADLAQVRLVPLADAAEVRHHARVAPGGAADAAPGRRLRRRRRPHHRRVAVVATQGRRVRARGVQDRCAGAAGVCLRVGRDGAVVVRHVGVVGEGGWVCGRRGRVGVPGGREVGVFVNYVDRGQTRVA